MKRAALVLLGGCDLLFGLDDVTQAPRDAASDAPVDAVVLANHDEDNDGFDDVLDVCPSHAGPQVDTDLDGVGDVCDPHPGAPIDKIYFFDAFVTLSPRWVSLQGTWETVNDQMQQLSTEVQNNLLMLDPTASALVEPTIEVVIETIGGIDAGAFLRTGSSTASLPEGVACYYDESNVRLVYFEYRPVAGTNAEYTADLTGSGFPIRLAAVSNAPGAPLCAAAREASAPSTTTNANQTPSITTAHVALYTYWSTASFRSATVYVRR